MKTINLQGRVALVTGAAGQLGRTICRALAECGADVALCYRSKAAFAEALAEELRQTHGVRALAVQADVGDAGSIAGMKQQVNDALGTVDILVNCAAVPYEWETVLQQPAEDYEEQFRSCVLQGVLMAQAFAPDMVAQAYGRIIALNTECAMQMFPYQSAYVAGKRGMDGVYRVLAKEVGQHNVTVNQVAPGWTVSDNDRTPDPDAANNKQDFPYAPAVPMRRRGTDEEVANAVCFLASDLASFITGVYLPVSGGNVMPCI